LICRDDRASFPQPLRRNGLKGISLSAQLLLADWAKLTLSSRPLRNLAHALDRLTSAACVKPVNRASARSSRFSFAAFVMQSSSQQLN
jgi:hypothetical protein